MIIARRLAIVGSGPTALYLLKHLADLAAEFGDVIATVEVFEQYSRLGMGMPYSPSTTDRVNRCNISSKELPPLERPFVEWLRSLDEGALRDFGIVREKISADETYSRLAMGEYFADQFRAIVSRLAEKGIQIIEHANCRIIDINDFPRRHSVLLETETGDEHEFDAVVIASGHDFNTNDDADSGYYASPWPIQKLLPAGEEHFNFRIGTLGASLSAFDVVSSLAHRHGTFSGDGPHNFVPIAGCEKLKFVMHSTEGWLPHLQYEQEEPFRELYRHVTADQLAGLRDSNGFMRLDDYFDVICRPALIAAFAKDRRADMVAKLRQSDFDIEQFTDLMTDEHDYIDAFGGMRSELPKAEDSVDNDHPIHWKEVVDDLMYTLNFHAQWMPAEDHIRFQSVVMPFLLNVIAAMPLHSAHMLLALHDAGKLELVAGKAKVLSHEDGQTNIEVNGEGGTRVYRYDMFVDCTGQGAVTLDQFPFPSLVKSGTVRPAEAAFLHHASANIGSDQKGDRLIGEHGQLAYKIGGIDIDSYYRVIGDDGTPNTRIYDVAFPHGAGVRPYSYGLQACDLTARIVVDHWKYVCRDQTSDCEASP